MVETKSVVVKGHQYSTVKLITTLTREVLHGQEKGQVQEVFEVKDER